MTGIADTLCLAAKCLNAGRVAEAEAACRAVLARDLAQPEAWHLLGVAASRAGRHGAAVEFFERAIRHGGAKAIYLVNLGAAYHALGRSSDAAASYGRAVLSDPRAAEAHNGLGVVLAEEGRLDDADAHLRRAISLNPTHAGAHNNLGNLLRAQGRNAEAVACYRRAAELRPGLYEAQFNLGIALECEGQIDEAIACYRNASVINPSAAAVHHNLGNALQRAGRLDEAIRCYRRALELEPRSADALYSLGLALGALGMLDDAAACYGQALALKPDHAGAAYDLGRALVKLGRQDEALPYCRRAIELNPRSAEAHNNAGGAFKARGDVDAALACYRRALELDAGYSGAHSNLLLALNYCHGVSPQALADAHAAFDRAHARRYLFEPTAALGGPQPAAPPFRLGFISPDFREHPVGYLVVRAVEELARGGHEVYCYSCTSARDEFTRRFERAATVWREVARTADEQLAEQVRSDRVGILFDLTGHTAGNRLLVFARRPAPVQVTWAGYPGSTGLAAMDYILADGYEIPPGAERHYREQVLRMPDGYVCFQPPGHAPPVAPPPVAAGAPLTFGSYNNPAKLGPPVIEVWARILRRLPTARLSVKFRGVDQPETARRLAGAIAAEGIDPARLILSGFSPHAQLLAAYAGIDVALDPFPFGGGLTTCEALWMGVPVITCPGETFASRHSLSHLSNVGLTETIARDLDEYVEIAVGLANDLPRLAAMRARLRPQMAASPLCDGPRFARNLEALLRDVWRRWCEGNPIG